MPMMLEMALAPERLGEGSPEERAAFGLFTIRSAHGFLTEGFDSFINGYRSGPLVSGYHVAEWLAWNWWRLRWEPRSVAPDWDWDNAHRMTAIGEGYVWPNVTIFSDGLQMLAMKMPENRPHEPFFRPLWSFADEEMEPEQAEVEMSTFLLSPRIASRTDDDLTLVLASLGPLAERPQD